MNGIHDMGGLHGFGTVSPEPDEPVFHARWEGRVFALTQLLDRTAIYNLDEHRHEIELMPAADYLRDGYYGRWLFAMERILDRKDILRRAEVETRLRERSSDYKNLTRPNAQQRSWPLAEAQKIRWGAWRAEQTVIPKFKIGDRVRARNWQPAGHTRLPAYVRDKPGVVSIVNAQAWILPDTRAHNAGENVQPVYNIAFKTGDLWGDVAEPNVIISVDLSEDYLTPQE